MIRWSVLPGARHISPALVVALIALFISMSTSAWAVMRVTSANIVNGTIKSRDIGNGQVRSIDLNPSAKYDPGTWIPVAAANGASFAANWQDYPSYEPAAYRKDSNGYVYLRGAITNTGGDVGASTAMTLPAGYRPGEYLSYPVGSTDGSGTTNPSDSLIDVQSDGVIFVFSGTDDRFVTLSGISFKAEQ